tara:strand:+ start:1227 stop:1847 length:621 start_codon:yes stop_codon:yes gene_type:complete
MPNWCNNNVEISGPKKVIDQIEKIVDEKKNKKGQGLLDWMCPMPKELRQVEADGTERKDFIKKYGHSDWYGWANDNWGTKWDIHEFYGFDRKDESTITFGFDTAWAPALTAFETWLANNDDCSVICTYYEPGCDFAGVWDNGDDRCIEISKSAPKGSQDRFWNTQLGKTLDDYFGIVESMAQYEEDHMEDVYKYSKGEKVNIGEEV